MLKRIHGVLVWLYSLLHSILLTFFVAVVAMMLVAWLGGPWGLTLGAGVLGLAAGVALSKRLWFGKEAPVPVLPPPPEWRIPLVQDEYERLRARQGVLASLFLADAVLLAALRLAWRQNWPGLFGIPRERLLLGGLVAFAAVVPLGLWNWRCPHCRRNLGSSLWLRQCPRCGVVLRG